MQNSLKDQTLYEQILQNSLVGIVALRSVKSSSGEIIDFEYIWANEAAMKILKREDLIGQRILELFPENIEYGLFDIYLRVIKTGKPESLEIFYGGEFNNWGHVHVIPTEEGISISFEDISEQKAADFALISHTKQLEIAHELAKIGTWEWDLKTGVPVWSEGLCNILECPHDIPNASTELFFSFVHPEDREMVKEDAERAVRENKVIPGEYRIVTPGGKVKYIYGTGTHILNDEHGKAIKLFGIVQDITDLKQTEIALAKALGKEMELNQLKSRFVSFASHEFRTPLTAILNSTNLLGKYKDPKYESKRMRELERIKSNVSNMRNTLTEFLSLSKLEEGKIEVQIKTFDLPAFCREAVEGMQGQAKPGQTIEYEHYGDDRPVHLDPHLLLNILNNLLSNSIKYSPPGKQIRLLSTLNGDQLQSR